LSDKTVLNSDSSAASNNSLMDGVVWEQAEAEAFRSVDESIELVDVCRQQDRMPTKLDSRIAI